MSSPPCDGSTMGDAMSSAAPTQITPDELNEAVTRIRKDRARGKVSIPLNTASELLKAVELGVVSKAEARTMLGLKRWPQPRQLRKVKP
jgi:hypothetical protein